jgi:hypothetical protein
LLEAEIASKLTDNDLAQILNLIKAGIMFIIGNGTC